MRNFVHFGDALGSGGTWSVTSHSRQHVHLSPVAGAPPWIGALVFLPQESYWKPQHQKRHCRMKPIQTQKMHTSEILQTATDSLKKSLIKESFAQMKADWTNQRRSENKTCQGQSTGRRCCQFENCRPRQQGPGYGKCRSAGRLLKAHVHVQA